MWLVVIIMGGSHYCVINCRSHSLTVRKRKLAEFQFLQFSCRAAWVSAIILKSVHFYLFIKYMKVCSKQFHFLFYKIILILSRRGAFILTEVAGGWTGSVFSSLIFCCCYFHDREVTLIQFSAKKTENNRMIKAILIFNNHGKPRLIRFYQYFVSVRCFF